MELKYSSTGIPYIDLGRYGRLAFSKYTAHPKLGYKYLAYNNSGFKNVPVTVEVNGKKKRVHIRKAFRDSDVFNFKMKRDEKGIRGIPRGTIPQKLGQALVQVFDTLTEGDYMPFSNIELLGGILAELDMDEICKVTKKKARKNIKKEIKKVDKKHS
jgi:hypothetical protein